MVYMDAIQLKLQSIL